MTYFRGGATNPSAETNTNTLKHEQKIKQCFCEAHVLFLGLFPTSEVRVRNMFKRRQIYKLFHGAQCQSCKEVHVC